MDQKKLDALKALDTYEIVMREDLPDIHAEGLLLSHKKTGARVLLLPCKDSNKVFNIGFRTPPKDSTGVAHIIEHTVLCGSRKYPLKDPFVELAKGSLNTFLNAMTFPDKTIYPLASTNEKDFKNLIDVYLDAVFYPNIYNEERLFKQEGWSYRLEKESDPITYNGVVYNEMKGAFSSADDVLERLTFSGLFPDTPYGVESGGDPARIPDLTYEQFLDFHRTYYHPSNSYIYLYGDMNMAAYLKWIDKAYLSHFDYLEVDSAIPLQEPFREMKVIESSYPIADGDTEEHNTYLSLSHVLGDPTDIKESLAFDAIDYALFSSQGAPVKEILLKAGIGQDVYSSYNDGILQPYYSIVAKGAEAEDRERFLKLIKKELKKQVRKGIDTKALLAGINYLEFSYREADYATYPKGLIYAINALDTWLYDDARPFDAFKRLRVYEELKKEVRASEKHRAKGGKAKGYFEELVEKYFLKNEFGAFVVLRPERGLTKKQDKAVEDKLALYKASLSEKDLKALVKSTADLKAFQEAPESPEALKKLPSLKRSDLKKTASRLGNLVKKVEGRDVVFHKTVTNGIGYLTLFFDAGAVHEDELPLFSFLTRVLGRVNTKSYSYQELDNEIGMHTGSIGAGLMLFDDPDDKDGYRLYLTLRMKAVYGEMKAGFKLIREILMTSDFSDTGRLKDLFNELKMQSQMMLQQIGHAAAGIRANAYYASDAACRDLTGGIGFYKSLKRIEAEFEERPHLISDRLKLMAETLIVRGGLIASYTADDEGFDPMAENLAGLIEKLPEGIGFERRQIARPYGNLKEAFMTAGQVQFVAQAGPFDRKGDYNGHQLVLRQLLNYDYLWQKLRVTGGAYGCSATFTRRNDLCLRSFRDPHLKRTVDVYKELPAYLETFDADEDAMTKLIIGTLSLVDTPLTPSLYDGVCMQAYMNGITKEERQRNRDDLLATTAQDIRDQAVLVKEALRRRYLCVIGSETVIEKDKALFDHVETLV